MTSQNAPLMSFTSANWNSASHRRRRRWRYVIAASHHVTFWMGRRFPNTFPLAYVLGFPKSGTSWVCQVVADYLRLPFPQNSLFPIGCPAVVHGHERCHVSYARAVYVMRDGRDALASMYFHLQGRDGAKEYSEADFEGFVQSQLRKPVGAHVDWGKHVRSYWELPANHGMVLLRYESILQDPVTAFSNAIEGVTGEPADLERLVQTVEKFDFSRQRGAAGKKESRASYLRKGKSGDWRNHFTPRAKELFANACGEMLIRAGYEIDEAWVSSDKRRAA